MAPSPSSSATSVQVALRIRPQTSQDNLSIPTRFQRSVIHATSSNSVSVEASAAALAASGGGGSVSASPASAAPKKQNFNFDQVHPPPTTQHELYTSTAEPLTNRFLEGFNCTILAYGQTSSGKTFTMTGIDLDADPSDPHNGMGIIPRAVSSIFSGARNLKEERGNTWNYSVKGSFIEIYNEDLIDLLSADDTVGGKREVQIREDKSGHIIWGGLREVPVRNPNEVMNLLRQGTSIRRTNETDMNATSSRSHAIFSLTLTQKKFTGSGPPPRSSSPLPSGRSPSRLARPGSIHTSNTNSGTTSRIASPTFGRPATPSFQAAMGRGGGLRPGSALGMHASETKSSDGDGEWVTLVSKFHFVDLAGSERLKRTGAAGERAKEGISINSGLLALGNVISALGDPSRAKSHTATHIPYRDSKLTRLLQDSLGGNAHTLMIACVSPAEYNVAETINTLKYANRARNIKNRAVLNEREDGWDDVEWLQGTVTRLRKELKGIKEGGAGATVDSATPEQLEGAGKKVLAQLTDLQNNYEDLRGKFVERTEELTRLRQELGDRVRGSSAGTTSSTAKYEEIVGPVIEEYEKTISAMEAELSLNRAALRHTNEMVEEKEEELAQITERHAATEMYVEELRVRVSKLQERESSTEAYIRDLEEKMKVYDETSLTSSESMTDLKREVSRFKDVESHSAKYIAELEARLARSDESVITLQQSTERLEKECERRRNEAELLQTRLDMLKQDGESWRAELDSRERKVRELEDKMEEWERKKDEANQQRERLGNVVGEVAQARKSLQLEAGESMSPVDVEPDSPTINGDGASGRTSPHKDHLGLETQLLALQQTHTATLTDLSSVTAKYRDALREISDLASQIQEAKLSNLTVPDTPIEESAPPSRRRIVNSRSREFTESPVNGSGRRLFFRQAASTESLHSRSLSQSQSLSQELSSARSRKTSFSSHGTSSSISQSPKTMTGPSYFSGATTPHRPNLSISVPSMSPGIMINGGERSVSSLEKEIMRLQEVLKEREAEISVLEESLKEKNQEPLKAETLQNGVDETSTSAEKSEVLETPQLNGDGILPNADVHLSPQTLHQFDSIRKSMENGAAGSDHGNGSVVSESDDSLTRLNELMLSMAQKESQHREIVDKLSGQLAQVKRQHDDLATLSRDQTDNMSAEIAALHKKYDTDLEVLQRRELELQEELKRAETEHASTISALRTDHEHALLAKSTEVAALLAQTKEEHAVAVNSLRDELAAASTALEKSRKEHEESFGKLKDEHDKELRTRVQEANDVLTQTKEEHESSLRKLQAEYEETAKQKEAEASITLQTTEEEYYDALTKLRSDHAAALEKHTTDAVATLEKLRQEHAEDNRQRELAQQGVISESQSSQNVALQELQDAHAASIARKEASFADTMEGLKAEHTQALATKGDDYKLQMDKLRAESDRILSQVKEEWRVEVEKLKSTIIEKDEESSRALTKQKQQAEVDLVELREQNRALLDEITRGHEEDITHLKDKHSIALSAAAETNGENAKQQLETLMKSHTEETAQLKSLHQEAVSALNADLVAAQERHREALEKARTDSEQSLAQERAHLKKVIADLEQQHSAEREILRKDHDLLVQELEAHKTAGDEFLMDRQKTRASHDAALDEKTKTIEDLQGQLVGARNEKSAFEAQIAELQSELEKARGEQSKLIEVTSNRDSVTAELEKHRSVLAELQENLQKVKDEKDTLHVEKTKQESIVRDLQAQIAQSSPSRPTPDRAMSHQRVTGISGAKLPPPTPPPSVPPPPAPRSQHQNHPQNNVSMSSQSSGVSSRESQQPQPESPLTSVGPGSTNGHATPGADSKATARIAEQAKRIEEQETMIKTLNKQLTHCETDLQAHMDIVSTLESSLGDSEKNLRKARMQATELARERDTLNTKLQAVQNELQEAKREVLSVRRSVVEEKQSLELRLDEERKAKERARAQLDQRMDELTKRKSKFACL